MKIAKGKCSECIIGEDWTLKKPIIGGTIETQGEVKTSEAIAYFRERFSRFIPETWVEEIEPGSFQIKQRTIPNAAELGTLRLEELKKEVLSQLRNLFDIFHEENRRGMFHDIKGCPREEFINKGLLNSSNIVYSQSEESLWFVDCADAQLTKNERRSYFQKRRKPLLERRIIAIPFVAAKRFYADYIKDETKQQRQEIRQALQEIERLLSH